MSTGEQPRPQVIVDRPDEGDLEMAMYCFSGIFWALEMLASQKVADEIALKSDQEEGIDGLIQAGQLLSRLMTDRF